MIECDEIDFSFVNSIETGMGMELGIQNEMGKGVN